MSERVPLYREVATMRVNTNRRNPGAVVRHIVHRLECPAGEQLRRRRRSGWRRLPTVLNPGPNTEAPPSPSALARKAEARND
jgi:shikimate kinase